MNKKIKVVWVQAKDDCPFAYVEIENTLEALQKFTNASAIDIVERDFDGERLCVVCDDEGLLKLNPQPSAIWWPSGKVAFVGNLIITGRADAEGELTSLTLEQVKKIFSTRRIAYFAGTGKRELVVVNEYTGNTGGEQK